MDALIKNAEAIKHSLSDYDQRRTMQKLELNTTSLHKFIDDVLDITEVMEVDGSMNERLLQALQDKAEKLDALMLQHQEQEENGHDTYTEEDEA